MKKLISALAILGCLVSFGMAGESTEYVSEKMVGEHVTAVEKTVAPEDCEHNMDPDYDMANRDLYNDINMFDLYMDAVIARDNHCEDCGDMYYDICRCWYEPELEEMYRNHPTCECGDDRHEIDYLVFVNDYAEYMNACALYCSADNRHYYDHCCEEPLCDFFMYMDTRPLSEDITNAYNSLPESVKKLMADMDCTLDEVDALDRPTVLGVFRHNANTDYTAIEIKRGIEGQDSTTYHEFGHLLDYGYNEVFESESSYFVDIYNEEKDNFVVDDNYDYYVSSPKEYFAQAFAEYMMNPDRLYENTPFTYFYVDNVVNNIE